MATVTKYPSGVGAEANLGQNPFGDPNWTCVDETPANDADYVVTNVGNTWENDLYDIPTSGIPAGSTINSVTVYWRAKKTVYYGTVAGSGRPRLRTNATNVDGSIIALTTSWVDRNQIWNTNPVTTAQWQLDEINALQIGVGLDVNDIENADCKCSQVYVVIAYTEVATGQQLFTLINQEDY
jgi:hypothetical protein